jgi:hypothetical protein
VTVNFNNIVPVDEASRFGRMIFWFGVLGPISSFVGIGVADPGNVNVIVISVISLV